MWLSYGVFALATLFTSTMGIAMDLRYVHGYSARHNIEAEYKGKRARQVMRFHIYLRLIGLMGIPLTIWFVYLMVYVAKTAQE
jgi:hypothetical protein